MKEQFYKYIQSRHYQICIGFETVFGGMKK